MKEKIDSGLYLTIFTLFFIGLTLAFFLGLWVGSKSTVRFCPVDKNIEQEDRSSDSSYEEKQVFEQEDVSSHPDESKKIAAVKEKKKNNKKVELRSNRLKENEKKSENLKKTRKKPEKNIKKKPDLKKVSKFSQGRQKSHARKKKDIRYMLQIGAYYRYKDAVKLKLRFEKKGYSVFIEKDRVKKNKTIYKVRIGVFYSKKIALKVKRKIEREDRVKAWLVPIK